MSDDLIRWHKDLIQRYNFSNQMHVLERHGFKSLWITLIRVQISAGKRPKGKQVSRIMQYGMCGELVNVYHIYDRERMFILEERAVPTIFGLD